MQISQNTIGNGPSAQAAEASGQLATAAATPRQSAVAQHPETSDTATLSLAASLLSQALTPETEQPAKVQQIASAVGNGTYTINSHQLSSAVMQNMLDAHADR